MVFSFMMFFLLIIDFPLLIGDGYSCRSDTVDEFVPCRSVTPIAGQELFGCWQACQEATIRNCRRGVSALPLEQLILFAVNHKSTRVYCSSAIRVFLVYQIEHFLLHFELYGINRVAQCSCYFRHEIPVGISSSPPSVPPTSFSELGGGVGASKLLLMVLIMAVTQKFFSGTFHTDAAILPAG